MNQLGLLVFLAAGAALFADYSSANYLLSCEGNSGGRIYAAGSPAFLLDGSAGENSGSSFSLHYEFNSGWYYTVNSDDLPPDPAGGLAAVTLNNGNIKLTWSESVDKESATRGYRVYRSVKQYEDGLLLVETGGNEYTDIEGLIFGVNYYYRVKPVDVAGNQTLIGNIVITALSRSLSSSVTSLSVSSLPGGRLELAWQGVLGLVSYCIYRSTVQGEKGTQTGAAAAAVFSETLSDGLLDAVRYFYTVQGVDGAGNEQQQGNNQGSAVCDAAAPSRPEVFSTTHPDAAVSTDNCPCYYWVEAEDPKAPAGGATGVKGYYYCLSRNSAETFTAGWIFINELSVKFANIQDGDWYFYVLAEDRAGNKSAAAVKQLAIKTTGNVSGCITDFDGKTFLQDSRVDLVAGRISVRSSRTGLSGKYLFSEVPFGSYKLRIFKAGHDPFDSEELVLSKTTPAVILNKSVSAFLNIGAEGVAVYPNPCRLGFLTFVYKVATPGKVIIDIFDATGRRVAGLEEFQSLTGFRETRWDVSLAATGVYFYAVKLENNGNIVKFPVKKFSLIR